MQTKDHVVIGLIGSTLDSGVQPSRWEKWRPSVALCQQEHLLIKRFELLCQGPFLHLARTLSEDIATVSPETTVRVTPIIF